MPRPLKKQPGADAERTLPCSADLAAGGGLSKEQLLRLILQLDDPALTWLCHQLLVLCSDKFKAKNERPEGNGPFEFESNLFGESDCNKEDGFATERDTSAETTHNDMHVEKSAEEPGSVRSHAEPTTLDIVQSEEKLADSMEAMLEKTLAQTGEEAETSKPDSMMEEPSELLARRIARQIAAKTRESFGDVPENLVPTITFESSLHHCQESDLSVSIGVIRIGPERNCQHRSEVKYCTHDASATAGQKYQARSGTLIFEAGERRKTIDVPIYGNDNWDFTLEFEVELLQEGLKKARLSKYGHLTRVKILDEDTFPTCKFQKQLLSEAGPRSVNQTLLMIEYFKMNMHNGVIRRGILKFLLSDCVRNTKFVVNLFLDMWMVDYVLCSDESKCPSGSAPSSLFLIAFLKLSFLPVCHYLRYRSNFWQVAGASRMVLQVNLLRKYLNYDEKSLGEVNDARLILAINTDAHELVQNGFCQIPKLFHICVRLVLILMYQLLVPVALGETLSTGIFVQRMIPVMIFPLVIGLYLAWRLKPTMTYLDAQHGALDNMTREIQQTISNSRLIQDYLKRGFFIDRFAAKISEYNTAAVNLAASSLNNQMVSNWCTMVVLSVYIPLVGISVVSADPSADSAITLGSFLNSVAIIKALGVLFENVYSVILDIIKSFEALSTIVHFLNLPTELGLRALQHHQNVAMNRARLQQNIKEGENCPVDDLCIEMRDLSFVYNKKGHIGSAMIPCTLILPQGGFYTFVGPPSQGKGTILKLLGGALLPYHAGFERSAAGGGGTLMTPSHLRVLHVSKDPMFTEDTLLENLTFGCVKGTGDNRLERVLEICKECAVPEHLLNTIKDNRLRCDWLETLSGTESACLHIARALIANPEILVIHKPTLFLNTEMADMMCRLLQRFVHQRGLATNVEDIHSRRPRTCIISARRIAGTGAQAADAVFLYSSAGLKHLRMNEAKRLSTVG